VKPAERHIEFLYHLAERNGEGCPPAYQHIVMARAELDRPGARRKLHHVPQSAPHPVTLDGVAHLPRDRKAYANRPVLRALQGLENERSAGCARTTCHGSKIGAALEPLDNGGTGIPLTH
jgi:hypothetical protein